LVLAVYRNGVKVGNAQVSGTSWSFADSGLADVDYSYTVRVEDTSTGANGVASVAYTITVDTAAPVFTSGAVASGISENSGAGQVVYTATTSAGGSEISYSLKSGAGDSAAFTIDPETGEVTLTGNPDFET